LDFLSESWELVDVVLGCICIALEVSVIWLLNSDSWTVKASILVDKSVTATWCSVDRYSFVRLATVLSMLVVALEASSCLKGTLQLLDLHK